MKKFLAVLAVLLCMCMTFASCAGTGAGGDDDAGATTTQTVETVDPAKDIETLVNNWNSAISSEVEKEDIELGFEKLVEILDKYQLKISDREVDGVKKDGELILNSSQLYLSDAEEDSVSYFNFIFEDGVIDLFSLTSYDDEVLSADVNTFDINEMLSDSSNIEIALPELSADDFKDEGDRCYSLKREAIDRVIEAYLEAILDACGVESADMRETKALFEGYLEDITIDIKYKLDSKGVCGGSILIDIPKDVYFDFLDTMLDSGEGLADIADAVDYEYACKIAIDYTNDSVSFKSMNFDIDLDLPWTVIEIEENVFAVGFIELGGKFSMDIEKLLSASDDKLKLEGEFAMYLNAYKKNGDNYVYDEDYTKNIGSSSKYSVDASLKGEKLELNYSSSYLEMVWDDNSEDIEYELVEEDGKFACKVKFGKADIPELTGDAKEYQEKFEDLRKNYDAALERAEDAISVIIYRMDPDEYKDGVYEDISYYDEQSGVYFTYAVECDEYTGGLFEYELFDVNFVDPHTFYFIEENDSGSYSLYASSDPDTPISGFLELTIM